MVPFDVYRLFDLNKELTLIEIASIVTNYEILRGITRQVLLLTIVNLERVHPYPRFRHLQGADVNHALKLYCIRISVFRLIARSMQVRHGPWRNEPILQATEKRIRRRITDNSYQKKLF